MIRLFCILIFASFLAACATTAEQPRAATPVAAQAPMDDAQDETDDGIIETVDVPKAQQAAVVPNPAANNQRVCRMERRTGTNRAIKVCRTQAEIEQDTIESKETFDELRRSQQEYQY